MSTKTAVVVTSISPPNSVLKSISKVCDCNNFRFILIGDVNSPSDFKLENCEFYSIEAQKKLQFQLSQKCPIRHYSRKNIGYLLAIKEGAQIILETDDDNSPLSNYGFLYQPYVFGHIVHNFGWVNVYSYFTEPQTIIWPRGFSLCHIKNTPPDISSLPVKSVFCPIRQGLVLGNPDVDALWRLIFNNSDSFKFQQSQWVLILKENSWCPFNSQNTTWLPKAYPLLYLPSYCSFRMTDIWRSFIAQRIIWTCDWGVAFHEPTVNQQRNKHDLMKDFEEEVYGYKWNHKICEELQLLPLRSGENFIIENLQQCYDMMVSKGYFPKEELKLLNAWIADLSEIQAS